VIPPDAALLLPAIEPPGVLSEEALAAARVLPMRPKNRPARPIDVVLKSEPRGALAAVDGRPIGTTPAFWAGESDGFEHEFTFSLAGHAFARYRFVPITSGVLHVTLQPVATDPPDGGLEPLIAPTFAPDPEPAPSPPPAAPPPSPPSAPLAPSAPSTPPGLTPTPAPSGAAAPAPAPAPAPAGSAEPRREPGTGGLGPTP
jgi:hypothetical protein